MKSFISITVYALISGISLLAFVNHVPIENSYKEMSLEPIEVRQTDTLPAISYIKGQYLLDIDELLDTKLATDSTKGIIKPSITLGIKRAYRSLYFANKATVRNFLNMAFPFLNLRHDDVRKVGESFIVVQFDSMAVQKMRTEEHLQTFEQNYILQLDTDSISPVSQKREAPNWGVQAVSNTIKSDLQSTRRVWIVDSGIDPDHEELNVDRNLSKSFTLDKYYTIKTMGDAHGTHVAGIIGAKANEKGIIGVAPNIGLVAVRVAQESTVEGDAYLEGLKYVLRNASPSDVVNISLEKTVGSPTEKRCIQDIANRGIYVVIAAGNGRIFPVNLDLTPMYPASFTGRNIYTIASYNEHLEYSGFSAYGNVVRYCAPGERILSTLPGNRYGIDKGTSMAAPHVSGLLVLQGRVNRHNDILCPRNNLRYPIAHE
jgi:hypothetical protein